jgi:hypothetical protein
MSAAVAAINYRRTRAELEEAIGVEPIERLQHQRRMLVQQVAPLRAKYGERGTWEARRKVIRFGQMTEIADALEKERGKRPSEAEAERLAGSGTGYVAMLDQMEQEMARYILLEDEIQSITERIRRDESRVCAIRC